MADGFSSHDRREELMADGFSSHDAYDPSFFRQAGHLLVDQLADYLERAQRREGTVLPHLPPLETARARYAGPLPSHGLRGSPEDLLALTGRLIEGSIHLHHPGYVGHQVAPPVLVSALGELVSGVMNQSSAVYEMGSTSTQIERQVVRWLCELVGWGEEADGFFTQGGSLGNLTGLLAARQVTRARLGREPRRPFVLVSDAAHYSVRRAAAILGLGEHAVVAVPTDERYRIRPEALHEAWRRGVDEGRDLVAVAASACTTATGSFDPLEEIGAFCGEHGAWLHVDGAHGASVLFSERHRALVRGIEKADSIAWDAHKMLMVPALGTAVLFRNRDHSYETCGQQASYLFGRARGEADFDVGLRTIECTKGMLAWKLWLALQWWGREGLGALLDETVARASFFARLLREQADFELWGEPQVNIVCFRYRPAEVADGADLDEVQLRVRRRVVEEGRYYLVQTRLGERTYLRVTLMNAQTTEDDLGGLLEAIRRAG